MTLERRDYDAGVSVFLTRRTQSAGQGSSSAAKLHRDVHIHSMQEERIQLAGVGRLSRWFVEASPTPLSLTQFTEAVRWNLPSGFGVVLSDSGRQRSIARSNGCSEGEE